MSTVTTIHYQNNKPHHTTVEEYTPTQPSFRVINTRESRLNSQRAHDYRYRSKKEKPFIIPDSVKKAFGLH